MTKKIKTQFDIIDSHVHCFPDKVAPAAIASLARTSFLKPCCEATRDALLRSMEEHRVAASVILPIATNPKQAASCNRFACELAQCNNMVAFGSVHPDCADIKEQLRFIKDSGLKGIKLHPDFQGHYIDSSEMVSLMYEAANEGLMIYIHGGLDISYPEINRCTPHRLSRALTVLGGATVICAHLGGYGYLSDSVRYLAESGIYTDISAVLGYFPDSEILRVIRAFGAQRVLFGTDHPWDSPSDTRKKLSNIGLTADEIKLIEHENAEKLFDIELIKQ